MSELNQIRPDAEHLSPPLLSCRSCTTRHRQITSLWWLMGRLTSSRSDSSCLCWPSSRRVPNFHRRWILLLILALQMIAGRPAPVFPRWITDRPLPTRRLGAVVTRVIPILRTLEKSFHPRFPTPPEATKRVVGIAVLMLSARLMLTPIPLSNILPALLIALISLAYIEEDGLMLSIGLLAGSVVIAVDLTIVSDLLHSAKGIRLPI